MKADPPASAWALRRRTLEAMAALLAARWQVSRGSFGEWRHGLGLAGEATGDQQLEARRLAAHVERAARRLPLSTLCLPRAVALGTLLGRRAIPHRLVIAVRPSSARTGTDDLHAWVEAGGKIILGELPGEWARLRCFPDESAI